MAIQIVCPNCQTTYNLAEEQSGKRVRCKKCETIFTAELPQAKPDVPSEELPAPSRPEPVDQEGVARRRPQPRAATPARRRDRYADDDQEDFRTSRPRARKRRSSHLGLFLIVGGVIASLVMVIGCAVLALWLFTREQTRNAGTQVAFDGPRVLPVPPAVTERNPRPTPPGRPRSGRRTTGRTRVRRPRPGTVRRSRRRGRPAPGLLVPVPRRAVRVRLLQS